MRIFRPWQLTRRLYPEAIFRVVTQEKQLCLSFDDGPDPGSTPGILKILAQNMVEAVFFCSGLKAERYPDLMGQIRSSGHQVGNHGYSHLDGWKTSTRSYIEDVQKADTVTSAEIFRPPYGRITPFQYKVLQKKYRIYLWDLMPYDFDPLFGKEATLEILKAKLRPGSLIVLHDSPMSCAWNILDNFIKFAMNEGYAFTIFSE